MREKPFDYYSSALKKSPYYYVDSYYNPNCFKGYDYVPNECLLQSTLDNQSIYSNKERKNYSKEEASAIADALGINFNKSLFDLEQFQMGLDVELEHGTICPQTNVTFDDPILTGKIALVHLFELPDYYTRLKKMEEEGDAYWSEKNYHNPCY